MRIRRRQRRMPRLKIRQRRRIAKLLVLGGAVELGRRLGPRQKKLWQRIFAKLPDDFPPKAMFLNVQAIREQNQRIIRLLEEQKQGAGEQPLRSAG